MNLWPGPHRFRRQISRSSVDLDALEETEAPYFLLSAGGNDALGGGNLKDHLRPFSDRVPPSGHLLPSYDQLIDHALSLYDHVFRALEARDVVTFCHGYDYAIPNGQTWLGKPMEERGIVEPGFQREIVRVMVDNFNARLGRLSARFPKVRFIDMRNAVGDGRWYDELHPTKEGYAAVAERFHEGVERERAPVRRPRGAKAAAAGASGPEAPAVRRRKRRGISLHVGVNAVNPKHYVGIGDFADLASCELDAEDMAEPRARGGIRRSLRPARDRGDAREGHGRDQGRGGGIALGRHLPLQLRGPRPRHPR